MIAIVAVVYMKTIDSCYTTNLCLGTRQTLCSQVHSLHDHIILGSARFQSRVINGSEYNLSI